ncbi:MAG: hypothetical protein GVY19_11530 [Bacteroidetes bacterium]|jgi:uncharacterized protein (DUF169 family)|nr:hypothetical protein [Bacteroidota bacterium]
MINELKNILGNRCSAINFNGQISAINIPDKKMKLCEALNYSFVVPIQINTNKIGCPGARRSTGIDTDSEKLASFISDNTKIPVPFIMEAFENIPTLDSTFSHINLGITEDAEQLLPPDIFVAYVAPSRITRIMHVFAQQNIQVAIPPYSLLSVCGNVIANTYINKTPSISFGCPESRKHGGVQNDEVVIGIPVNMVKHLLN